MTVNALLNDKPAKTITLPSSSTLADICNTLAKNRIGTVLIVDDGKLCGIVSERDVVRILAASGNKALNSTAGDCMTKKLVTCTRTDTVSMVMERMTTGRFRHIPIVENDELLGIVSIGDVVKYRMAEVEREAQEIRDYIATT
ncbi:CBS domain protein [hydrothermal vent metagenome]|uniref:CBS domain protein n=1 Tax=hydrothermal vent metagenome TaxID=652676 RepID=A0A3B0UJF1_9ZZZZ